MAAFSKRESLPFEAGEPAFRSGRACLTKRESLPFEAGEGLLAAALFSLL
jgi:hypothetical protein